MSDVTEEVCTTHEGPHGYISNKDDYLKRLRRIEGQARGLQGMVSDEKYCIDILTQISAMTSALQSVALGLPLDPAQALQVVVLVRDVPVRAFVCCAHLFGHVAHAQIIPRRGIWSQGGVSWRGYP